MADVDAQFSAHDGIHDGHSAVIPFQEIVDAMTGVSDLRRVSFPTRFVVLGLLSPLPSPDDLDRARPAARAALALCLSPPQLVAIVRGPALDSWTTAFSAHCNMLSVSPAMASVSLEELNPRLGVSVLRDPSQRSIFILGAL
jgi:hypothetical protein